MHLTTSPIFDSETFYRMIINNNLFRPLGWTPPRPIEPYRLLGTLLPTVVFMRLILYKVHTMPTHLYQRAHRRIYHEPFMDMG